MSCLFLLQRIFPNQGSNPPLLHLLHWQVYSLPLSHLRSPEGRGHLGLFVLIPFSSFIQQIFIEQVCHWWHNKTTQGTFPKYCDQVSLLDQGNPSCDRGWQQKWAWPRGAGWGTSGSSLPPPRRVRLSLDSRPSSQGRMAPPQPSLQPGPILHLQTQSRG